MDVWVPTYVRTTFPPRQILGPISALLGPHFENQSGSKKCVQIAERQMLLTRKLAGSRRVTTKTTSDKVINKRKR